MRLHSAVTLVALAATASSPAAPPTALPLAPVGAPMIVADSPVRCRLGEQERIGSGTPLPSVAPMFMPGPPPPPPPPPPPALLPAPLPPAAEAAADIVVTGTQVTGARMAAPGIIATRQPYGTPGNTERYDGRPVADIRDVASAPVSTFSVDVDTGAYANVRRFLREGEAVPAAAVRTEEMINYFRYDYPRPTDRAQPFSVTTDVAATPWNADTRLLRIGLRAYDVPRDGRPPANLVFLVDVSGSMDEPTKLPLVKAALTGLADRINPRDRVSIVVYAGNAGIVLDPTSNPNHVKAAVACLQAGGSTAGGQGIELAYATARANRIPGGVNRILLATDGDFNVGISDNDALEALVKRNRDDGITLTTLGFGAGNYNEAMMERIADVGNGNYSYIDSAVEARKVLDDELEATLVTVAKDVKVQVEFNPAAVSQYRLIGYENRSLREQDFTNDAVDAGDIGAGHQVTALYEVVPAGAAGWTAPRRYPANAARPARGGGELAFVKLRYKLPDGRVSREMTRPVPARLMANAAAPRGDMAFAVAVAAFGQRLRDDPLLARYDFGAIRGLAAGAPGDYRQEFLELTRLADHAGGPARASD